MAPKRRSPFARKQAAVLSALYHMNDEERAALLKKASPVLVKRICECALNVLCGNVPLTRVHKSRLRKHVHVLRKLADPTPSLNRKKALLVQRGSGFIPALLAPLIGTLLSSIVARN